MSLIDEYFINPILQNGWFNPVNTVVYAIMLVIAVYFVYMLLDKMNIRIDGYFFAAIVPFIFWASSTRVLHDASVAGILSPELNEFYSLLIFPTPGSYIITFFLALFSLLIALVIQRYTKLRYWHVMFFIGFALCVWNVILLPAMFFYPFMIVMGLTGFWTLLFMIPRIGPIYNRIKKRIGFFSSANIGILCSHFLDASATFAALTFYGYVEQHVVPRILIDYIGPSSMFLLKIIVVIPVLWLIDRYTEPGSFRNFLKIVVLILGLAPGLRDLIRLMVGV